MLWSLKTDFYLPLWLQDCLEPPEAYASEQVGLSHGHQKWVPAGPEDSQHPTYGLASIGLLVPSWSEAAAWGREAKGLV